MGKPVKTDITKDADNLILNNNLVSNLTPWKDEAWRKEFWKKAIAITLVLFSGYIYYLANQYNNIRFVEQKPMILLFPIDKAIPFNRFYAIPYYYWYFYIAFTVLLMFWQKTSKNYYRLVFSMSLGVLISSIIYIAYPTYVPRSELIGTDALTEMIRRIYSIDPPYNCFPSMHVLYSFICCWYLLIFKRVGLWFDALNIFSFVMISLSTVFTKQHYTPDILGGIVVGAIVCSIFTFAKIGQNKKQENQEDFI